MAIRQQLSSMLFVRKICEAQIKKLKTGDVDASVLHQVGWIFTILFHDLYHIIDFRVIVSHLILLFVLFLLLYYFPPIRKYVNLAL